MPIIILKNKTQLIKGSGNIWDRAEIPEQIIDVQKEELETAWAEISRKYTKDVKLTISSVVSSNVSSGEYDDEAKTVYVETGNEIAVGCADTLHHEIHHHTWFEILTNEEINNWKIGALKIFCKTGSGPTKYVNSVIQKHAPGKIKKILENIDKLAKFKNIDNITINMCYQNYDKLKKSISNEKSSNWFNRIFYKIPKHIMEHKKALVKEMEEEFDNLSEKEKLNLVRKEHALQKIRVLNDCDILGKMFFIEAYAETGGYVHAKKSAIERSSTFDQIVCDIAGFDPRINKEIAEYVKLYKNVFIDDYKV